MGRTTNEIRKRIQIKEEKLNRELTKKEINQITKSVKRKVARENFIRGAFLSIGLLLGAGGQKLLPEGENKQQTETQIDIENPDQRKEFLESLSVKIDPTVLREVLQEEEMRENVEEEISQLQTKDAVLDYIKDIYINEYNEQNGTNYTKDQLAFSKTRNGAVLHDEQAQNGDYIIKEGYEKHNYVDTEAGVIKATIKADDKAITESVLNTGNDYKTIYSENEQVDKYEDNFLAKMGPLVDYGIDFSTVVEQEDRSEESKNEYKSRFVNAVNYYKNQEVNKMINPELEDDGFEHY